MVAEEESNSCEREKNSSLIFFSLIFVNVKNNSSGRATERGVHALESHRVCSLVSQQADTWRAPLPFQRMAWQGPDPWIRNALVTAHRTDTTLDPSEFAGKRYWIRGMTVLKKNFLCPEENTEIIISFFYNFWLIFISGFWTQRTSFNSKWLVILLHANLS